MARRRVAEEPAKLLQSFPSERLVMWSVDWRVGKVKNQDAGLAEKVALVRISAFPPLETIG